MASRVAVADDYTAAKEAAAAAATAATTAKRPNTEREREREEAVCEQLSSQSPHRQRVCSSCLITHPHRWKGGEERSIGRPYEQRE